jgi:hypothetical protein
LKALRTWRNLNQQKISDLEALPIPPQPFNFPSTEAALNVAMYNSFLGCVVSIICFLIDDVTFQELEAFNPAYQNLPITAELMERHDKCRESGDPYKTCDAVRMGISIFLFHGVRKCFSSAWQKWSVFALRSIGREGLSNGFTSVNTIEVIYQLEDMTRKRRLGGLNELRKTSSLGSMRNRLIPLLMPRSDDGDILVFYLRYRQTESDDVQIFARAAWKQGLGGSMQDLNLNIYDSANVRDRNPFDVPQLVELSQYWRQAVEKGWHGYLETNIQEGSFR